MKHKNPQGKVYSFAEAIAFLGARSERKIDNNTVLRRVDEDTFAVRLHGTDVVRIGRDGLYRLYSGGYQTNTTKDRLNRYSPARVHQTDGEWYVTGAGMWGTVRKFFDGITVDDLGRIV